MSCSRTRATFLNPNNFWVLLRILPISSAKLETLSMAEGICSHQFVSSFHTCTSTTISKPTSYYLCKSFLSGSCNVRNLSRVSGSNQQQSFTVSYLVNSIGLSPQAALTASKLVNFGTSDKPDKVVNLFKNYGFTQTQISSLIRRSPALLSFDAEKIILPKLEFLNSKGISGPEITKKLSVLPSILHRSLAKQIIPSYDFFRNLFQSDERLTAVVKRYPDVLIYNIENRVVPNINVLREHGVPDSNIASLIMCCTKSLLRKKPDQLSEIVKKVEDMGFESSKVKFVLAIHAFLSMTKSTWQNKIDAYKKCGWSEEDVLKAFQRHPWCMMQSKDKIMACMSFFTNEMGSRPSRIANHPKLLALSLDKRLIPRYSVFQFLLSKDLVNKKISLAVLFDSPEKKFLQKFVTPYKKEAPEVLKLYKEKLNLFKGSLMSEI